MVDEETFLITLYVMIDDLCKSKGLDYPPHPGPQASLSCSEMITLMVFGQWARFQSERDFYRYAQQQLRWAFPHLPDRSQFNRHEQQLAGWPVDWGWTGCWPAGDEWPPAAGISSSVARFSWECR